MGQKNGKFMAKINVRKLGASGAVIVLLIFLKVLGALQPVEAGAAKIFNPLFSGFYSFGTNLRLSYQHYQDKRDFSAENKKLSDGMKELQQENARLKFLQDENNILRNSLNFLQANKFSYVLGNIVSRDILKTENGDYNIIIDKGSEDNLTPGLAVVDNSGVIIGKIVEVQKNLAKACLIVSPQCKFAVAIGNKNKTSGVLQGDMGLTAKIALIPQTEEIKVGDIVVSSGLVKDIPRGLLIGNISSVQKENNELWQQAVIEPASNPDDLFIVSVLLPQKQWQ